MATGRPILSHDDGLTVYNDPMTRMTRREFVAGALAVPAVSMAADAFPIVDTHTHFYDPFRPQGVPWPPKENKLLYRAVLPDEYRRITRPLGVRATIEIEASAWLEDNQWVLDLADQNPVLIGSVGDLEPGKPGFARNLERFHKNPMFLGIRLGILWGRNLFDDISNPQYIQDLTLLAEAGLQVDAVGQGNVAIFPTLVRMTDRIPDLRVVIDHMPFDPPQGEKQRAVYESSLRELGQRPSVYSKCSNILRRVDGRVPEEVDFYRPSLDYLWETFGQDRLIYGCNWPVSERFAPYPVVLKVVREYFTGKGATASERYFWRNSKVAYRWKEIRDS